MNFDNAKRARVNNQINAREVRVIAADGKQIGIISVTDALMRAQEVGLDLVEISPQAKPPVCRIIDYGKYLFEQGKKLKKKSKQVHIKEIKLRPVTDIGDYLVKIRKAVDFLKNGDKVKFTVRFRGREISYQSQGLDILKRIEGDMKDHGSVDVMPKMEGKQLVMVITPLKH